MDKKYYIGKMLAIGTIITGIKFFKFLLNNIEFPKYSKEWIRSLSDDELDIEREKIRLQYCSAGIDYSLGIELEHILHLFDSEMEIRKRTENENIDYDYPKHREHGWYLANDD